MPITFQFIQRTIIAMTNRLPLLAALAVFSSAPAVAADPFGVSQALNLNPTATVQAKQASAQAAATPNPGAAAAKPPMMPPQQVDYSANLNSDVFGANLFTGAFAR